MGAKISNVPVKTSAKPWIKQPNSSCCLSVSLAQKILSLMIPHFNPLHPAWHNSLSDSTENHKGKPLNMSQHFRKNCHPFGARRELLSSSQETTCACNKMDKYFYQQFYSLYLYLLMANANISIWLDDGFVNYFCFVKTLRHSFQWVSRV